MILSALPHPIRILILILAGAAIGGMINWAIYARTYFLKRPISPWMKRDPAATSPTWADRIPVLGWILLRRDAAVHGKRFWVRPLLIEMVWAVGLPWFYYWQLRGGLTGGLVAPLPAVWPVWAETWFMGHSILIALMFVATFIDFDERTIPDFITIPGTLIGLLMAALFPWFRLPDQPVANLAGATVAPIHFASSQPLPDWHHGVIGLIIGWAIVTIWVWALLPKICTMRYGMANGLKFMLASVVRPRRKLDCPNRTQRRGPFGVTYAMGLVWIVAMLGIGLAKLLLADTHWDSLFGSLIGLGFGGGMIWSIRLVAGYAMGREAMGFGDVTLMAMIGAFLGWQASLMTFAIAPMAALIIVAICFLVTKDNELAFGPYLCFGCMIMLLGWSVVWPRMEVQFFFLGWFLFVILFVCLVLMAIMLVGIQWVKFTFLGFDEEQ